MVTICSKQFVHQKVFSKFPYLSLSWHLDSLQAAKVTSHSRAANYCWTSDNVRLKMVRSQKKIVTLYIFLLWQNPIANSLNLHFAIKFTRHSSILLNVTPEWLYILVSWLIYILWRIRICPTKIKSDRTNVLSSQIFICSPALSDLPFCTAFLAHLLCTNTNMETGDLQSYAWYESLAIRGCELIMTTSGIKWQSKCNSLLYLSTIFDKSACNKVNFFWSTFTWNEVVLRSNVLLRYFHFVAKYFVTFSHLFNFTWFIPYLV
jgi:hypothetical protein